MSLNTKQQIFENIKKSSHILLAIPKNWSGDAIASGLALRILLSKLNKPAVDIACDGFVASKNLSFLPHIETIKPTINNLRNLVISLNLPPSEIDKIHYEKRDDKINIFVSPQNNNISAEDISVSLSKYKYDLIISLDSPDLESLGDLYQKNADFFYSTPLINIDHDPSNEQFGQINLVEVNSTSNAEIIFNFIESLNTDLIDEEMATCLLTGIISKTRSFKTPSVTPHALNIASQLIARGARREEIVKNLYQTKTIGTLKLWGKTLIRLKNDPSLNLAWSLLTREDFITSGAEENELPELIDELIANSPETEIIALFHEDPTISNNEPSIYCLIKSLKNFDLQKLNFIETQGTKNFQKFRLTGKKLAEVEMEVINEIKRALSK